MDLKFTLSMFHFPKAKPFHRFVRCLLMLCGFFSFYFCSYAQPGSLDLGFQASASQNVDRTLIQPDGKIIIVGDFTTVNGITRNHIARLNTDGTLDTSFDPGVGPNSTVQTVSLQPDGKMIIGGNFNIVSGSVKPYIARLNSDGTLDATFSVPGSGVNGIVITTAIQPDGKILLGGFFTAISGTNRNYLARLDANGTLDATFNPGTGGNSYVANCSLQPDGKIVFAGSFTSINGTPRAYLVRLNADGTVDTGFNPGNVLNSTALTTCIQTDGKILVGGAFTSNGITGRDRIARFNTDGTLDATFDQNTAANATVAAIKVQPDGKIVVGGNFNILNNSTVRNMIGRLNSDGTIDLSFDPQDGANNGVLSISLQTNGAIIIGGGFTQYNTITRNRIARLHACYPTDSTITVGACESYQLNSQTYTTSGTYTQVIPNYLGCDSTITLNLTISHGSSAIDHQTHCDSYTWTNGVTYYSSTNLPTQTLVNAAGCDSVVTLNLIIKHSTAGIDTRTACDSLTWIDGVTYYSSTNTPTWVLTNAAGCDSTVTLHLTVHNSSTGTETRTECGSYTWIDGVTYYTSTNTPTYTLANATGCDSTVTLNLTILDIGYSYLFAVECDEYLWTNGVTYTESGIYHDTLVAANGCDSIATLQLTIHHSYTDTLLVSSCGPYYWDFAQTDVSFSGTYSHTLITSTSCDSTQVLQIQVNTPPTANVIELADGSLQETSGTMVLHWLDCSNNATIANSSSIYTPTVNGSYAAIVYDGTTGCSDTSNCVIVNDVDISETNEIFVTLYPNPANDLITISFDDQDADLIIFDAQGKLISKKFILSGESVSLQEADTGVYFFQLTTEKGSVVKRVVKN